MSDLTPDEQKHVRTAIRLLRVRCGGWVPLTKALRFTRSTLQKDAPTPAVAFRVARLACVSVDDALTGKYPLPGTCAHCGHRKEDAEQAARQFGELPDDWSANANHRAKPRARAAPALCPFGRQRGRAQVPYAATRTSVPTTQFMRSSTPSGSAST
jgi:hypothetical protein